MTGHQVAFAKIFVVLLRTWLGCALPRRTTCSPHSTHEFYIIQSSNSSEATKSETQMWRSLKSLPTKTSESQQSSKRSGSKTRTQRDNFEQSRSKSAATIELKMPPPKLALKPQNPLRSKQTVASKATVQFTAKSGAVKVTKQDDNEKRLRRTKDLLVRATEKPSRTSRTNGGSSAKGDQGKALQVKDSRRLHLVEAWKRAIQMLTRWSTNVKEKVGEPLRKMLVCVDRKLHKRLVIIQRADCRSSMVTVILDELVNIDRPTLAELAALHRLQRLFKTINVLVGYATTIRDWIDMLHRGYLKYIIEDSSMLKDFERFTKVVAVIPVIWRAGVAAMPCSSHTNGSYSASRTDWRKSGSQANPTELSKGFGSNASERQARLQAGHNQANDDEESHEIPVQLLQETQLANMRRAKTRTLECKIFYFHQTVSVLLDRLSGIVAKLKDPKRQWSRCPQQLNVFLVKVQNLQRALPHKYSEDGMQQIARVHELLFG